MALEQHKHTAVDIHFQNYSLLLYTVPSSQKWCLHAPRADSKFRSYAYTDDKTFRAVCAILLAQVPPLSFSCGMGVGGPRGHALLLGRNIYF